MKTLSTLKLETPVRRPAGFEGRTLLTEASALEVPQGGILLVSGGSASGKSVLAEDWAREAAALLGGPLVYAATLRPGKDPENMRRIARHRAQRKEKGFTDLELPEGLSPLRSFYGSRSVVLFECLGNYLANFLLDEGYFAPGKEIPEDLAWRLSAGLSEGFLEAAPELGLLVVVGNDAGRDSLSYDPATKLWIDLMGCCQQRLAAFGGTRVVEAAAGIGLLQS